MEWLRQGVLKGTWSPVVSCDFDCGLQVAIGNSIVLCNLVSADRNGMAASRFLAAVGACVILLCFPAESRKSHCTGSMKVVMATDFFSHFGADHFLLKFLFKSASKSSFFRLGVEIRFWSCNLCSHCAIVRNSIVFCNSVSAGRSGMAASRFLAAAAACRILLMSFAAGCSRYFSFLAHPV